MELTWPTDWPTLLPNDLFDVVYRLDGGPNGDGMGWRAWEYDKRPNVPDIADLTFAHITHTTETSSLPGYKGGVHPHNDYRPAPERRFIQRVRFDRQAGTLKGASTIEDGLTVPTNRALVHQLEINAYSNWNIAAYYGRLAVRDLDDEDLRILARYHRWMHDTFSPDSPLFWFPKGVGSTPMTHANWMPLDGKRFWYICDHARAPDDSDHWDSDDIDRPTIMAYALIDPGGSPMPELIALSGTNRYDSARLMREFVWKPGDLVIVSGINDHEPDRSVAALYAPDVVTTNIDHLYPYAYQSAQTAGRVIVFGALGAKTPDGSWLYPAAKELANLLGP